MGQTAAQILERPTANAVYGQVSGDGIVVPLVNFGVEILRILCFCVLLVEPITRVACQQCAQEADPG